MARFLGTIDWRSSHIKYFLLYRRRAVTSSTANPTLPSTPERSRTTTSSDKTTGSSLQTGNKNQEKSALNHEITKRFSLRFQLEGLGNEDITACNGPEGCLMVIDTGTSVLTGPTELITNLNEVREVCSLRIDMKFIWRKVKRSVNLSSPVWPSVTFLVLQYQNYHYCDFICM